MTRLWNRDALKRKTTALLAAAVVFASGGLARADEFIGILTGGTSGVYYPMGVALSKIYSEKIPGSRPSVQATKASVENLTLLQQGKGEIAFTLGDVSPSPGKATRKPVSSPSSTSCAASPRSIRTTFR